MYVCVCRAVCEREVEAVIDGGATTVDAVTRACGAGGDCGACHEDIAQRLLARAGDAAAAEAGHARRHLDFVAA